MRNQAASATYPHLRAANDYISEPSGLTGLPYITCMYLYRYCAAC